MRKKSCRIHGRKILGFPCGDVEVEQQICDFYIEEDSHEFNPSCDYPIEKAFDLLCKNQITTQNKHSLCSDSLPLHSKSNAFSIG